MQRETTARDWFERCHGACWTTNAHESDALWRVYAPHRNGVRVRSTVGKLWRALARGVSAEERRELVVGRVACVEDHEIVPFVQATAGGRAATPRAARRSLQRALFVKSRVFAHEEEVRLVVCDVDPRRAPDGVLRIAIDPSDVVEELLLDPRFNALEVERARQQLAEAGWSGAIARSSLYDPPPLSFPMVAPALDR